MNGKRAMERRAINDILSWDLNFWKPTLTRCSNDLGLEQHGVAIDAIQNCNKYITLLHLFVINANGMWIYSELRLSSTYFMIREGALDREKRARSV